MNESHFGKLKELPLFARPPRPEEQMNPAAGFGAARAADGRTARRTGRIVQFATIVSPEFKRWMKVTAAQKGKSMAALLDDMKAVYIEKYGE